MDSTTTIAAIATPRGRGGLSVIRVSGPAAFEICDKIWKGKRLSEAESHTAHFGRIVNLAGETIDEAVATLFRGPKSFTGEDTVELSIHGSEWIQRETMNLLLDAGASAAGPGEFSQRAFLNGRLDLAQAEGIADLIEARSRAAHRLAMSQLKGTFSRELEEMRGQLVDLASLLELELDFSEEDVEFADRQKLLGLTEELLRKTRRLADSYRRGHAFKEGIPVVIAGRPNTGKSTLLNTILEEERAIVSDIPGTTRDVLEDTREIDGVLFRFYDTAGLRATTDRIENLGIDRARELLGKASIALWMVDLTEDVAEQISELRKEMGNSEAAHVVVFNKADLAEGTDAEELRRLVGGKLEADLQTEEEAGEGQLLKDGDVKGQPVETSPIMIKITAREPESVGGLMGVLTKIAKSEGDPEQEFMVTNLRHREALEAGAEALARVKEGLETGLPGDLIAQDIRESLHHLGALTGAITTDTLLGTIFAKFCVGK